MTIRLKNGKAASEEHTLALESLIGRRLSASYLSFVRVSDGAEPETNVFKIDDKDKERVNDFIPVAEIPKERSFLRGVSKTTYPIAWAEGGNYVLIDESCGSVLFWDHELHQPLTKIADSFADFLNLLQPFDPSTITLKPGQVKRVWTHPDFDKLVKKYEK